MAYAPAIPISSHWGSNTARRRSGKASARYYREHAVNDADYADDDIKGKNTVMTNVDKKVK